MPIPVFFLNSQINLGWEISFKISSNSPEAGFFFIAVIKVKRFQVMLKFDGAQRQYEYKK